MEEIDFDRLRDDLRNEFLAAMFAGWGVAMIDVNRVDLATDEELIEIAIEQRVDLNKYIKNRTR